MSSYRPWAVLPAALWVTAVLGTGCGKDSDADRVRRVIGPSGGQIASHDGVLLLTFQPGTLAEDAEIEIAPSDRPPAAFGPAYRVKPDLDLERDVLVTYLHELPLDSSGTTIGAIRRADFESGDGHWVPLERFSIDPATDVVAAVDHELSLYYALLEDGFAEPPPMEGTGTGTGGTSTDGMGSTGGAEPESTGTTGTMAGESTGLGEPLSHAADIAPIWAANCTESTCHGQGSAFSPDLETDPYGSLVGQLSTETALALVEPGSLDESWLWWKLIGPAGCECGGILTRMPLAQDPLPEEDLDLVRRWILQGAPE